MPKKYFKRKKTTNNKPTLTRQVAIIKKLVHKQKPELKYYDVASTGNTVDNLPSYSITPYRNITQGTSDFANRIGDQIRVSSLHFKTIWTNTAVYGSRARIFAFIYKRNPDQVVSSWSTIVNLYLSSAYMNTTSAVLAERDFDNRASFVTLYDKTRIIPTATLATGYSALNWDFSLRIPQKYQLVQYVNAGTAVAMNELFIGFIQENDTAIACANHYRMYYTDP